MTLLDHEKIKEYKRNKGFKKVDEEFGPQMVFSGVPGNEAAANCVITDCNGIFNLSEKIENDEKTCVTLTENGEIELTIDDDTTNKISPLLTQLSTLFST
jgi:hypothetical protein